MRELREDTFSGNKGEDAHDHIDWVLGIVGLFNIPEVSKDAVMLRVFPFTLTGSTKGGWTDSPQEVILYLGSPQKGLLSKALVEGNGTYPRDETNHALTAIQTMVILLKMHEEQQREYRKQLVARNGLAAWIK
ncbi:hypothetical protein Tco_0454673 [Tanacetum coccineum]